MELRGPEAMVAAAVCPVRLQQTAADHRDVARGLAHSTGVASDAALSPGGASCPAQQWHGAAADQHRQWVDRFVAAFTDVTSAVTAAAAGLDEVARTTARTAVVVAELRAEQAAPSLDAMSAGLPGAHLIALWRRYDQVMAAQDEAESAAASAVAAAAGVVRKARFTAPRVLGLTTQQWRDVGRGVGDVAWEAGPGTVTWAQRWLTVPGLLGMFEPVDRAENAARAWLDEAGGGRDDTATYRWAYGSATVAAVVVPLPVGKTAAVSGAGRAVDGARDVARGADDGALTLRPVGARTGGGGTRLTPQARVAIADYTADGFWDMNLALRSERVVPGSDMARRVTALSDALSEVPVYQGMVYRGTDLATHRLAGYIPGEVVEEAAFTSASRAADGAFPGNVRFEIDSINGRNVSDHAAIKEEAEVLFNHHSTFRVVDRFDDSDTVVIVMREVDR